MPERRGDKTPDFQEDIKSRERMKRLLAVNRLRESPDFWVLKEFLTDAMKTHEKSLRRRVVTPHEQAEHHFTLGLLSGLDFALRRTEIIEQSTPLANEK